MILYLSDGKQIRGDLLKSAVLRSDLAPVPLTLEAEIRSGDEVFDPQLEEGKTLGLATGEKLYIVKSTRVTAPLAQGGRPYDGFRVTAILENCLKVAYVRERAIVKENASLSAIYRAAGASIPGIAGDFPVKRFTCLVGDTPTFHIARILQEEGGVVRWKRNRLEFLSLMALQQQDAGRTIPGNASSATNGGFLERHQVPSFYSLDDAGAFVQGNRAKPRAAAFSPFKNAIQLRSMTRCLVTKMNARIAYDQRLCAGDVVRFTTGEKYIIVTAAHVFESGTDDGGAGEEYSRLWLGEVEE